MKQLIDVVNAIGPILAAAQAEEANHRRISPATFKALKDAGLLQLSVPSSLGGMEADPLTVATITEMVAGYNVTAAWCMMVSNVGAWFCKRLPEKAVEQIFSKGRDSFIAGALHPPMQATAVEGGYRISGRTPLISHIHEAEWVGVSAFVMENGQMKIKNGNPEILFVVMNVADCEIVDTWHTFGMKATDSNDVAAKDVFVPADFTFPLGPAGVTNKYYQGPLYKFPAIGASIGSLIIPVVLAIARIGVDELKSLARNKVAFGAATPIYQKGVVQRKLGMAEAIVQSSRCYLHQELSVCWQQTLAGESISMEQRADLLLAITHANQTCVQAVDMIYSAAGSNGIYLRSRIAQCFTDAQVIRQHGFSNDSRYETAGQVYFGLPPDLAVVAF